MTYQIQSTFDENFKLIANLDPTSQALTTTYADVPDSNIDYKPSPSSTHVIYQFSVYFASSSTSDSSQEINCYAKLQYSDDNGDNWSDWGDNTDVFFGSAATDVSQRSTIDLKFALNASGWSSTKRLRIIARQENGSDTVFHQLETFFDSDGERDDTNKYTTSVSCYSID